MIRNVLPRLPVLTRQKLVSRLPALVNGLLATDNPLPCTCMAAVARIDLSVLVVTTWLSFRTVLVQVTYLVLLGSLGNERRARLPSQIRYRHPTRSLATGRLITVVAW